MNISKLFFVFASILAIVMVAGFASAESNLTFSSSSPSTIYIGSAVNFSLNNNGDQDINSVTFSYLPTDSVFSLAIQPISVIPATQARSTSVLATGNSGIKFGSYSASISARDSSGSNNATRSIAVVKSFCSAGPVGTNLTISSFSINSDGSDDEEWKPLDTVEVEVEVENVGDSRVNDVIVELGLFDSAGNNIVNRLDFINADDRRIEIGDLRDGDDEIATFEFTVPADFNLDDSDYKLAVKAYSKGRENQICIDNEEGELDNGFYQSISINYEDEEDKFISIGDLQIPSEAICGEVVRGSFKIVNIGEDDQEQVMVRLTNTNLALNEQFEIRDNLDSGDSSQLIDFSFTVPSNLRDGSYPLTFRASYDYRNGIYKHDGDSISPTSLKVIGCGTPSQPAPTHEAHLLITANAEDATPGQAFDVLVTFRNAGTESVDLELDASDFQSWGDLESISDDSFGLDAGESKTVTFSFNADEAASGSQSFTVEARSASGVETKDVDIEFPEKDSDDGFSLSGNKPLLWVIGAINVVLIVLIIVVAIRLARK